MKISSRLTAAALLFACGAALGKGVLTVTPDAPAGVTVRPESRVIEVVSAGPVNASFRVRSQGGDWQQTGGVSVSAELVVNRQRWEDSVAVVWPASLDTDLLFRVPNGWFVALVAGLLAIIWYRFRFLACGHRRSRLPDTRLLFDVLALLAVEAVKSGLGSAAARRRGDHMVGRSQPRPLLVKMSYHPNWHVNGAERVWPVSPSFMLIYPETEHVRLYYGPGPWDYLGRSLSLGALLVL